MGSEGEIKYLIKQIAGTDNKEWSDTWICSVVSVDKEARTCVVETLNAQQNVTLEGVLLMAAVGDGMLMIPAVDSMVVVGNNNQMQPYVKMFSDLDEIVLITGDTGISMTNEGIVLNDGAFGGLIKIEDLVKKVNDIENLVNDLVTKYNSHTHILTLSAGTGTAAPTTTTETGTLTPTQVADIENTKITHGETL